MDIVTVGWRYFHSEERRDYFSPPDNHRVIKLRVTRWGGGSLCVTRNGEKRERAGFWWGNSEKRHYMEDLGVHKIILKLILWTTNPKTWTRLLWLRKGSRGGLL